MGCPALLLWQVEKDAAAALGAGWLGARGNKCLIINTNNR